MAADSLRRLAFAAAVAAGVLCIVGCTAGVNRDVPHDDTEGGQTFAEMRSAVEAIDGIRVVEISGGERPNVKGNTGYRFSLEVKAGYTITDGAALVEFLMASAWSVREGYMPNAQIDISVTSDAGFDIRAAAAEAGWTAPADSTPGAFSTVPITLAGTKDQGAANLARLGPWPGDAPPTPTGITARD